ncbi:MAG TPA: hypothetical protein DCW90_12740 [Lachnospiraceae bacterium]|nr:RloB family protein [uncultured Lachnoclostridium sp.]HAU86320.1 hypothetical protein [Lachnospiraceae bacterium]
MGSDDLFKKRREGRKTRVSKEKKMRAETWLFVCEGKETEPNYFESLLEYANSKSDKKLRYVVKGTGRNTESLVNSIDDFLSFGDDLQKEVNIPYGKIFAIFDKDSFKKGQFNNAIFLAQKKGYHVLWSNECIELWFLLHFMPLKSNITREEYFNKLGNILNHTYEKNDDHFAMLNTPDNLKKAVYSAEQLYKEFQYEGSFAKMAPCTTVFQLIYELESYLGIKL